MEEQIEQLLEIALDGGITELDFWEMTPGEINRAIQSKNRHIKMEAQEKATYDYILAGLIGRHVARILGDKSAMPNLHEAYPGVFDEIDTKEQEEKVAEQKATLSALRFKQFAQSFNKNFNKEVPKENQ